jgi:NDP-sugar pyrophosphorylase family protein
MTEFQPKPQHPEEVADGLRNAFIQAKEDGVFDEPEHYDEVEWDENDNTPNLQKIIDKMVEERKAQKLYNILKDRWCFSEDACEEIVEAVAEWLPKEQNASGSQNVNTELLVDGFNNCLEKIKGMLR